MKSDDDNGHFGCTVLKGQWHKAFGLTIAVLAGPGPSGGGRPGGIPNTSTSWGVDVEHFSLGWNLKGIVVWYLTSSATLGGAGGMSGSGTAGVASAWALPSTCGGPVGRGNPIFLGLIRLRLGCTGRHC
jgi:hypothetical protein